MCLFLRIFSMELLILSIITIGASIFPLLLGLFSFVVIFISGLTLCLVICINPILLIGRILCFALSDSISDLKWSNNFFLFSTLIISIKSKTIIPPISLSLNCLAISDAAIKFTSNAVSS